VCTPPGTCWLAAWRGIGWATSTSPNARSATLGISCPSDFGNQGAPIQYKAWVCTNPNCTFNLKIRNGEIFINEPINDGSVHTYRR